MKKRFFLLFAALVFLFLTSTPSRAFDLIYDGVDIMGGPAQSIITYDSIEPNGLWLFRIYGGGPATRLDGSVYIDRAYLGTVSDGPKLADSVMGFGVFVYPFLYLFTSSVLDLYSSSISNWYSANIFVFQYDPFLAALINRPIIV